MMIIFHRRISFSTNWLVPALAILAVSLAVACGGAATAGPTSIPAAVPAAASSGGLEPILATKVLHVGVQRVSFLLTTPNSLVTVPEATVTSVFLGDGPSMTETKRAGFHLWPYGVRGSYATEINFDRPGRWRLEISVDHEGVKGQTSVEIDVAADSIVPGVGTVPPLSNNKTLAVVGDIERLTTHYTPDPDLYQLTIADAVANGRPTVVVFASPAFCTSPTCGPQTETVTELKESYSGQANFIHVEIYDNPHLIQGDLSQVTLVQPVHDWGISAIPGWFNESWTFILGTDGVIAQRFEGYAALEELEEALKAVLDLT
ncbi:MAG: thioredoxin family protein [Chloroflexi bacterium]|nr:thioredoxin family protein [Chloroflexota bacterium]MCH8224963.1 thioredoxin family protein [Chloroflexota bacterium]